VCAACDAGSTPSDLPDERGSAPARVPGTAAPDAPAIPADAPTVAFLGDSLSAGLHLARDEAFPAVLQRRLAEAGKPFHLVNAGVSGDTTAGGLARVDWLLAQDPDVVVIELGANDGFRGIPVGTVETNLRGIVARVRQKGARVLLLGVPLPPNYGPEYTRSFKDLYERFAAELEVTWVPGFMEGVGGLPDMNLADGIHPTPQGHVRLAKNVEAALAELL
jgi:acyl-CoA thioesterase-1